MRLYLQIIILLLFASCLQPVAPVQPDKENKEEQKEKELSIITTQVRCMQNTPENTDKKPLYIWLTVTTLAGDSIFAANRCRESQVVDIISPDEGCIVISRNVSSGMPTAQASDTIFRPWQKGSPMLTAYEVAINMILLQY
jgi:hypothetical protein